MVFIHPNMALEIRKLLTSFLPSRRSWSPSLCSLFRGSSYS
jgi:hypothetical protein